MRTSLWIFFVVGGLTLHGQEYESLHIEKSKDPDSDNKVFTAGKGQVYQVSIYESNTQKTLVFTENDWDLLEASEAPAANAVDKIIYLTASVKNAKRTNKRQTEVIIAYEPHGRTFDNTGIVENEQNI